LAEAQGGLGALRLLDESAHASELAAQAVEALQKRDGARAFRLSDRLCRIASRPDPTHLVLRADSWRMRGRTDEAVRDLLAALRLAPEDRAANRRMLALGDDEMARTAARALIRSETDPGLLLQAIGRLGTPEAPIVHLERVGMAMEGWAAWAAGQKLRLQLRGPAGTVVIEIAGQPSHPFASGTRSAAALLIQLPDDLQAVLASSGEGEPEPVDVPGLHRSSNVPRVWHTLPGPDCATQLWVIVPVYDDPGATRACLEALMPEIEADPERRLILVNDAAPDPGMAEVLGAFAGHPRVELLHNPVNLGFVGTVNRALETAGPGDLLLLNADTLIPAGALDRLREAARLSPDIGTVTPLSNNGELTSFPRPFEVNPLPSRGEVGRLQDAAARTNPGHVVDLPNGIGFCLYVTSACRAAIGPLSGDYHSGYLEDVDWCLRARAAGFRNVCATGVYVGHAGSLSFRGRKRALVVRNLAVLERRFPSYRTETAAFLAADPLAPARSRLEAALLGEDAASVLLVTGPGPLREVAQARGRRLLAEGQKALLVETRRDAGRLVVRVRHPSGGLPQTMTVALENGDAGLAALLRELSPAAVEVVDPRAMGPEVIDLLFCVVPVDLLLAGCDLLHHSEDGLSAQAWRSAWERRFPRIRRFLAPDRAAEDFATRAWPALQTTCLGANRNPAMYQPGLHRRIGFVPLDGGSPRGFARLREVLSGLDKGTEPTVLGRTLDDLALMARGTFVTGAVTADELGALAHAHDLEALAIVSAQPLFGHPLEDAARRSGLPVLDGVCNVPEPLSSGRREPSRPVTR
jgi:GT2 family glycosyltransferase